MYSCVSYSLLFYLAGCLSISICKTKYISSIGINSSRIDLTSVSKGNFLRYFSYASYPGINFEMCFWCLQFLPKKRTKTSQPEVFSSSFVFGKRRRLEKIILTFSDLYSVFIFCFVLRHQTGKFDSSKTRPKYSSTLLLFLFGLLFPEVPKVRNVFHGTWSWI